MPHKAPNIIYIMADDMGCGDVGCYGTGKIATPHMDRLAADGMRFDEAHAPSAVCTPTRYSVMTGRYFHRTYKKFSVSSGFCPPLIDPARTTVASLLKSRGYATGLFGKWHLGLDWPTKPHQGIPSASGHNVEAIDFTQPTTLGPTFLGFDRFYGLSGSLNMAPFAWIDQQRVTGTLTARYNGQTGLPAPDGKIGAEEFDFANVDVRHCEKAIEWITDHRRARPDQPFFLCLTPSAPHFPCVPPALAAGRSGISARADLILVIDWIVGQVCEALDRLGVAEDTLLMVTSDNGADSPAAEEISAGHHASAHRRGWKADIYDGGHREPLLVRWPSVVRAGSTCGQLVCLSDLLATCAELTDTPLGPWAGEDSISFLPLLRDPDKPTRRAIVHQSAMGRLALREGPWKFIDACDSGDFSRLEYRQPEPGEPEGQLFHMVDDPAEQNNLYDARPDVVERLRGMLNATNARGHSRDHAW